MRPRRLLRQLARAARHRHFRESGHPVVQSFEPGEDWFWDYAREKGVTGPRLADPQAHPDDQGAPAPADRVPADWRDHLND